MSNILQSKIERDIKNMINSYDFTKKIVHGPSKGFARETAFTKLLLEYLPDNYNIAGNCILFDSKGNISDECDIVIYLKTGLKNQSIEEIEYVPIENVKYIIEVKSKSTKEHLSKSIKSAKKVKDLIKSSDMSNIGSPICCYFAFTTNIKSTNSEFLRFINLDGGFSPTPSIEVICVPQQGYYYIGSTVNKTSGLINYAWSCCSVDEVTNIKMFIIGVMNTLNPGFRLGFYASEPGFIKQVYLNDVFNKYIVTVEMSQRFNDLQYAFEEGRIFDCIKIAEELFSKDESIRVLLSIGTTLLSDGNIQDAAQYFEYLLESNKGDDTVKNEVLKRFH